MTQAECVVFVGLQAAGKTTFFRRRFQSTHEHISRDNFPNARHPGARQAQLLGDALASGRSVVIDNTNPTPADRAPILATARQYGARVIAYFFEANTRASVGRNRGREGKARVPDVAIFSTAKRLVAPTCSEGFDEVYAVRADGTDDFSVVLICRS
jgi:predicted kinase